MDSFVLTIFGITGNLAQIKLLPALYDLEIAGMLPAKMQIIGNARSPMTQTEIRNYVQEALTKALTSKHRRIHTKALNRLLKRIHYLDGHLDDPEFYKKLKKYINQNRFQQGADNRIYYLATYPSLYPHIFENLKAAKLNHQSKGWVRLMIEKPIGNDFESAHELNLLLEKYFDQSQIYRLDHYLGKETVQNMLTFRFGNGLFEPLMSSEFVDHIQITSAEDFGIGKRAGYFDNVGALKDVGQNHLLQMLTFVTMAAPNEFSNRAVTDQRIKVLRSLMADSSKLVLGQYEGYKKEIGVSSQSRADTFFAFKTQLNDGRLAGVPIYVRSGKMLAKTITEISVIFKNPTNRLFKNLDCSQTPNILTFRIQPHDGIAWQVLTKKPGLELEMEPKFMELNYKTSKQVITDPYAKLILDALHGDQTFFNDADEVESAWKFIDAMTEGFNKLDKYAAGSWGPKSAEKLITADKRQWLP